MMHTTKTQLTSDPDGVTTVDMSYDGEGMLYTKSNPHRSAGSRTDGTSTYYYDVLGRTVQTTEQDGSVVQMCYDGVTSTPAVSYCSSTQIAGARIGTRVDTTDEAGSHWQRVSDAFGRLTQVVEPNGTTTAPTMETDYAYDVLNDLLSVNQWGGRIQLLHQHGADQKLYI
jgi:YD repeat-containing protein